MACQSSPNIMTCRQGCRWREGHWGVLLLSRGVSFFRPKNFKRGSLCQYHSQNLTKMGSLCIIFSKYYIFLNKFLQKIGKMLSRSKTFRYKIEISCRNLYNTLLLVVFFPLNGQELFRKGGSRNFTFWNRKIIDFGEKIRFYIEKSNNLLEK